MKKNSILLILIGALVIVFGLVNPLNLGKEEKSKPSENKPTDNGNNNVVPTTDGKFNGVYVKDKATLKLYTKGDKLYYDVTASSGASISGTATISNDSAEGSIFEDNYKFTLSNNNIVLETNDTDLESGEYTKSKDYTINDYFTDNYGDPKYATSDVTGVYEQGKNKLYVYQVSENAISFHAEVSDSIISSECDKVEGNSYTTSIFEDKYTLSVEKDKITVVSTQEGFNGLYVKSKSLTLEEIIDKF